MKPGRQVTVLCRLPIQAGCLDPLELLFSLVCFVFCFILRRMVGSRQGGDFYALESNPFPQEHILLDTKQCHRGPTRTNDWLTTLQERDCYCFNIHNLYIHIYTHVTLGVFSCLRKTCFIYYLFHIGSGFRCFLIKHISMPSMPGPCLAPDSLPIEWVGQKKVAD